MVEALGVHRRFEPLWHAAFNFERSLCVGTAIKQGKQHRSGILCRPVFLWCHVSLQVAKYGRNIFVVYTGFKKHFHLGHHRPVLAKGMQIKG